MINFNRLVDISKSLIDLPPLQNKHYSFVVLKNKIVSIGWNTLKTHPMMAEFKYPYFHQHSEVSAIVRYDGPSKDLRKCCLINVRLDKEGQILQSYPCKNCMRLLASFNFKEIFFTTKLGEFEKL